VGRPSVVATCAACGHTQPRWTGQCGRCRAWGTIEEAAAEPRARGEAGTGIRATSLRDVPRDAADRLPAGIGELDRALGGGLVAGSVVLLGGEPGTGKSTLLLQAAASLATGHEVVYVSAEESAAQVRLRAERLDVLDAPVRVAAATKLPDVLALVEQHQPDVLILDSVQTIHDPDRDSSAGSVVQVRECAAALARMAKANGVATVLVGHVTKEGSLAGPRTLEHLVDAVLLMEGDRSHALRLLRAVKNRFGAAGEVGCFEMTSTGLDEVTDASRLFLDDLDATAPGVCRTVLLEGPRPVAVEIQALTVPSTLASPRRQTNGLDASRVAVLTAVLQRRAEVPMASRDLFASVVGGIRVEEPAGDLALALAVASSVADRPLPPRLAAIGEIGLGGEVRPVPQLDRRLAEAARLGLSVAVVSRRWDGPDQGIHLHRVDSLVDAVGLLEMTGKHSAAREQPARVRQPAGA